MVMRIGWFSSAVIGLIAAAALHADAGGNDHSKRFDQDIALGAMQRGEILPLEKVLAEVRGTIPGEIVKIELINHRGAWLYSIRIIAPGGVLSHIRMDARTGKTVSTKIGPD